MRCRTWFVALPVLALLAPGAAAAADDLAILQAQLDRPTAHALGVQLLVTDDDNRNATVKVRYRKAGDTAWRNGPNLMRVWPETVTVTVPQQFAGSVFDLEPDTDYEIELTSTDPDGLNDVRTIGGKTRFVPSDPQQPNLISVKSVAEFQSALSAAKAGDVIELADGTYAGSFFTLNASGTAAAPIVLRGASQAGVVLDGGDCTGCNILEVYGSFVHVERMTLKNGERALRFQGNDTTGNVARHLLIQNVRHGIGSKPGQTDFWICDNTIEGKLAWPWVFDANASSFWDERGVEVTGDGHVVCHNLIRGFGDPIVNKKSQARAWDVYGNDVYDSFDGTELDDGEGNVRLIHNRYTNVMDPVSIQPVWGGPAYVLRNVALNVPEEPIKLKSTAGVNEPSGAIIQHNTFVSPKLALNLQTPITQHNFVISNNLFVGPKQLAGARTVDWTAAINGGRFDFNGYYPDGGFWFGKVAGQNQIYGSFAEVKASNAVEQNGVLLSDPIFAGGFFGPADETIQQSAAEFALAASSNAIDVGETLPGINESAPGAGPDLGAWEMGCPKPVYGPRAAGTDGVTNRVDCATDSPTPGTGGNGGGGAGGSGASATGGSAGGGGSAAGSSGSGGIASGSGADDGGCGCRMPGRRGAGSLAAALMGGLALLLLCRRRASEAA